METLFDLENPVVEEKPASTQKKAPKQNGKLKKITLNDILERSCWNPENFNQWEEWQASGDMALFPGVRRYSITMHCTEIVIRARRHTNGGYQILDMLEIEH